MIDSKRLGVISAIAVTAAVLGVIAMFIFGSEYTNVPGYAGSVFGSDIITVDIEADENDWQDMLDNAINEEYIMADVTVNGTKYSCVGIRPKGNNSLQQVYSSDSDRYSFKIKFDEYVSGQTCDGLDMLVLNSMLGDATYMKEYTTFEMMRELGIDTPYFGYSKITVNGEDAGLYFALESYNDSYKLRVSGNEDGVLYNVKTTDMNGGGMENRSTEKTSVSHRMGAGMGASGSGGSLVYTDDAISSYPAIFENVVGSGSKSDFKRVISAIKVLNEGGDIEKYFDVDEILRYLAVHSFVVNLDSYSSNMAQNYYIYEQDGVIRILPWDYNYAWGAFQGGSASDTVNFPVDTPVSGAEMSDRPLISKLLENEEYMERYHGYLKELTEKYFSDGKFDSRIDELDSLIGDYVKTDPTAFYTYGEYQTAISAFKAFGDLRAESVLGQINGIVPSTSEDQNNNADKLVDASFLKISDLGSGGVGGGGFGMPQFNGNDGFQNFGGMQPPELPDENTDNETAEPPDNITDTGTAQQPDGSTDNGEMRTPPNGSFDGNAMQPQDGNNFGGKFQRPDNQNPPDGNTGENAEDQSGAAVTAVSLVLLAAAIIGVSLVKSKF